MRVAIIDYGSGNLRSATKAFERAAREAGIPARIDLTADAERVRTADRIVLPGVGAYADCAAGLRAVEGMWDAVEEVAIRAERPSEAADGRLLRTDYLMTREGSPVAWNPPQGAGALP